MWPPEALPSPPGWTMVSGRGLGDNRTMRGGVAMRFFGVMVLTIALLQRQGRITYRALKRGFELDDAALEDLRRELIFRRLAHDEAGEGLVWIGGGPAPGGVTADAVMGLSPALVPLSP